MWDLPPTIQVAPWKVDDVFEDWCAPKIWIRLNTSLELDIKELASTMVRHCVGLCRISIAGLYTPAEVWDVIRLQPKFNDPRYKWGSQ